MTTSQRMFGEAADVIEAQAKEIHELKIELGEWVQFWRDKDNRALKARIEELEAFIKKQYQQTDALQDAFREIYEVYAGSDGFIPETCPEAYQQQLIKEMAEIAAKYMRKGMIAEEAANAIEDQAKRIEELKEALKPFAYYAEQIPDDVSDMASASGTVGDLRQARKVLGDAQ